MPETAPRQRRTCPSCGKVGYYAAGEPAACKQCGAPLDAPTAPAPVQPQQPQQPQQPAEAPLGFAIGALVCGLASLAAVWVFPMTLLLAVAAIVLGSVALSRNSGDTGVQLMSIVGIGAGALGLMFAFFIMPWMFYDGDGGSSYSYEYEDNSGSGGGQSNGGHEPGSGGGGSGGGGGAGAGGGVDVSVDAPLPAGLLAGLAVLAAAAWRRRA